MIQERNIRSPGVHYHNHHGANNGSNLSNTRNSANPEQMNAIMNVFNPMMETFLQQLANRIQIPNASENGIDSAPHSGSIGHNHHHPTSPRVNEY